MRERKNALADLKATENVRGNVLCCAADTFTLMDQMLINGT